MLVSFISQPINCVDETAWFASKMKEVDGLLYCKMRRVKDNYIVYGLIDTNDIVDTMIQSPSYEDTGVHFCFVSDEGAQIVTIHNNTE